MKGSEREQDAVLQIRISNKLKTDAVQVAEDNCQNISALVRKFLEEYVASNKK